jgi:hypothetical protein
VSVRAYQARTISALVASVFAVEIRLGAEGFPGREYANELTSSVLRPSLNSTAGVVLGPIPPTPYPLIAFVADT